MNAVLSFSNDRAEVPAVSRSTRSDSVQRNADGTAHNDVSDGTVGRQRRCVLVRHRYDVRPDGRMRPRAVPEADDSQRWHVRCRRDLSNRGRTDLDQSAAARPLFRFGRRLNVDDQGRTEHGHASGCDLHTAAGRSGHLRHPVRLAHAASPLSDELAAVVVKFVEHVEQQ